MHPGEIMPLQAVACQRRPARRRLPATALCQRAPLRVCRLLLLLVALPTGFILLPVYLRYRVYSGQMYPMSMTDMRLIDSKISPTWCQRQVVKSEATFNAFVVPGAPAVSPELVPVTMNRTLHLDDDMKEYWGFYLLKGSSVTVSACVRYPGASLIMIKGYKHLQNCAYIGDDSSEELDELTEAYELGLLSDELYKQKYEAKKEQLKKVDGEANKPGKMARHKAGVSFHDGRDTGGAAPDTEPAPDVTDHDPKELRELLEHLHAIREAAKNEKFKHYQPPPHLMSLPGLHRHRDTNVDKEERQWLEFQDIDGNISGQETTTNQPDSGELKTTKQEKQKVAITKPKTINLINIKNIKEVIDNHIDTITERKQDDFEAYNAKDKVESGGRDMKEDLNIPVNKEDKHEVEKTEFGTKYNVTEKYETTQEPNSKEVYEDILSRLQALGDKGKRVLLKLQESVVPSKKGVVTATASPGKILASLAGNSTELDHLRSVIVEAIDEEKTRGLRQEKRRLASAAARNKRDSMMAAIELTKQFNEDDEERNLAQEELEFQPDGYAEHHDTVNETTALDMSNSEFWSSFSSSEEALLECEGLILNLPLTPSLECRENVRERAFEHAAKANALTYRVPANGYYFFIFNSENEVQTNVISARFALLKARYDVTRAAQRCLAASNCRLPLDAFTNQKVVLEVPLRNNDSLWNEQFVVVSECEPRTAIYIVCVLTVPVLILVFGFQ